MDWSLISGLPEIMTILSGHRGRVIPGESTSVVSSHSVCRAIIGSMFLRAFLETRQADWQRDSARFLARAPCVFAGRPSSVHVVVVVPGFVYVVIGRRDRSCRFVVASLVILLVGVLLMFAVCGLR